MFVERLHPFENGKKKFRKNNAFSKALIWEVCCVCFGPISFCFSWEEKGIVKQ